MVRLGRFIYCGGFASNSILIILTDETNPWMDNDRLRESLLKTLLVQEVQNFKN
jgi:hypothetical protein